MTKIEKIANEADMIVDGYAFTACQNCVHVFNLNNEFSACVYNLNNQVLETNMDAFEAQIVDSIWQRNRKFMEADYA
jgi:hypothetical protein